MENQSDRDLLIHVVDKIDGLSEKFYAHQLKNQEQHDEMNSDLKEHMKRSAYNEEQVRVLKEEYKPVLDSFNGIKIAFTILSFLVGLLGIYLKFKS